MPTGRRDHVQLWTRVGLAALVEGAKAVPGVGSLIVAAIAGASEYLKETISSPALSKQARDAVRQLAEDYRKLLASKVQAHSDDNALELALTATLKIISTHGLSVNELVEKADLDAGQAAKLMLQREQVKETLTELYDTNAQDLTARLVREYYDILLRHKDALDYLGLKTLRTMLARQSGFETRLDSRLATILANQERLLKRERVLAWRKVRWPERTYNAAWGLQPLMLRPEYRLVDYVGQEHKRTRDELLDWLRGLKDRPQGERIGLRCYVGPGGVGKTRLLLEVGTALEREGWLAGFLNPGGVTDETAHLLLEMTNPTLLVLDYVGGRWSEVDALLNALAAGRDRQQPYALVLLDRSEPDWLRSVVRQGSNPDFTGRPELQMIRTIESKAHLVPQLRPEDLPDLYSASLRSLATAVEQKLPEDVPPSRLPCRPLYVLLLALLAVAGKLLPEDTSDETSILKSVWEWELSRLRTRLRLDEEMKHGWIDDLASDGRNTSGILEKLQVVTTLGRVFVSKENLATFLEKQEWLPRDEYGHTPDAAWLAHRIARFLPAYQDQPGIVASIQPDPLADYVLAQNIAKESGLVIAALPTQREITEALETKEAGRALFTWLERVMDLLARIEQTSQGNLSGKLQQKAGEEWLSSARSSLSDKDFGSFLNLLDRNLPAPDRTLSLRSFQVPFYQSTTKHAQNPPDYARAQGMLGNAFSALGRREEALAATQEAVDKYRELAAKNPGAFLPDLAGSLNNVGARLSDLGRREEALAATQEAVEIRRELAEKNPGAFLPYLAMSLGTTGSVLRGMNRHKEAAESFAEGLRMLTPLLQKQPAAFAELSISLLVGYLASIKAAGMEADDKLVEPVQKVLEEYARENQED